MNDLILAHLEKIRQQAPLIHNITNFVVMGSSANILLAIGASPVMAHCEDEIAEMTGIASALVLNIGTLQPSWIKSMIIAGKAANKKGIPVILDPVGAGATWLRTSSVHRIMDEVRVSVLRGNASEVLSLFQDDIKTKGVDSSIGLSEEAKPIIRQKAKELDTIIGISGEVDFITDGNNDYNIRHGHPIMTKVTGLGCGLSAVVGTFCAVADTVNAETAASAFSFYGQVGQIAEKQASLPGSFYTAFIDTLADFPKE